MRKIYFKARVATQDSVLSVAPQSAYLDTIGKQSQTLIIENTDTAPYEISVASQPPEFMTIELTSAEIPAGGRVEAILREGPETPVGEYSGSVTLRFQGKRTRSITVPIYGMGYYR
jgi:hypothetical protein